MYVLGKKFFILFKVLEYNINNWPKKLKIMELSFGYKRRNRERNCDEKDLRAISKYSRRIREKFLIKYSRFKSQCRHGGI